MGGSRCGTYGNPSEGVAGMACRRERRRVSDLEHDSEMAWARRARCRGLDPDQFFVRGAAQAREAARVCQRCEVKEECLRYALDHDIDFGVWGGLTERQRRAYQRRLAS